MKKLSPIQELSNAIILQAIEDYRTALGGGNVSRYSPKYIISKCEQFFRSSWFDMLTDIDGEVLIEKIRKEFKGDKRK